jgi:hypothetical protein
MTEQFDFFARPPRRPRPASNAEHLQRVSSRIGASVMEFCRPRVGQEFHMEQLVRHIRARLGIAPDSPSRILRALRQNKCLDYTVVNRRQSLYRVDRV